MGLFDKKEEVPQIPPAPSLPELPRAHETLKRELPELPSFPSSAKNESFNREMVKSAVADVPEENEVHVDIPEDLNVVEESSKQKLLPSIQDSFIPELPKTNDSIQETRRFQGSNSSENKSLQKQNEPVFVRIDKFQSAQKNFEQIKEKVKEIESIIGKVKEVKSKEEEELHGWSEDIEKIKSRLSEIDSEIFNQI